MTDNRIGTSFAEKHKLLLKIAGFAGVASWVISILYILLYTLNTINALSYIQFSAMYTSVAQFIAEQPVGFIQLLISTTQPLITGVMIWFILQAVSLGLRQLVETNANYRSAVSGGAHE